MDKILKFINQFCSWKLSGGAGKHVSNLSFRRNARNKKRRKRKHVRGDGARAPVINTYIVSRSRSREKPPRFEHCQLRPQLLERNHFTQL